MTGLIGNYREVIRILLLNMLSFSSAHHGKNDLVERAMKKYKWEILVEIDFSFPFIFFIIPIIIFFHSLLKKPLLDHFGKKGDNLYESLTALLQNDVWYIKGNGM